MCGVTLALAAGCATIGRITNLSDEACATTLSQGVSAILVSQGEKPDAAESLADRATKEILIASLGPRPFVVSSPSGTDYTFFVQLKKSKCLLRLYGRQRGFWSYTNNLTYIATRPLPSCTCSE
jgi:hypothetical protein